MTITASRNVVLAMMIAAVVFVSAHGLAYAADQRGAKRVENPLPKLGGVETFVAWGVVLTFLIILADIPATGELAESFAWLFLIAVLFTYGVAAFENLQGMLNQNGGSQT